MTYLGLYDEGTFCRLSEERKQRESAVMEVVHLFSEPPKAFHDRQNESESILPACIPLQAMKSRYPVVDRGGNDE